MTGFHPYHALTTYPESTWGEEFGDLKGLNSLNNQPPALGAGGVFSKALYC